MTRADPISERRVEMARKVYVDTGAFLALLRPTEAQHRRVRAHFDRLRAQRDLLVTSDAVVAETATRLRYDAGLPAALAFRDAIAGSSRAGGLVVRESDPGLRSAAFDVMARYDGLVLSYADCVGAALARREHVAAVIGLDTDFTVMGFPLEPTS